MTKRIIELKPYQFSGEAVDIALMIGVWPAMRLFRAYGGKRLYVPSKIGSLHRLSKCVGYRAALSLVTRYAGSDLKISKQLAVQHLLDAQVLRCLGMSNTQIASAIALSRVRVDGILSGFAPDEVSIDRLLLIDVKKRHRRALAGPKSGVRSAKINVSDQIDMGFPLADCGLMMTF